MYHRTSILQAVSARDPEGAMGRGFLQAVGILPIDPIPKGADREGLPGTLGATVPRV